jgi:hypothetical protein
LPITGAGSTGIDIAKFFAFEVAEKNSLDLYEVCYVNFSKGHISGAMVIKGY